MRPVARLGDLASHGAVVLTGSPDHLVDGLPVARLGDLVHCPQHGVNPIVLVLQTSVLSDGQPRAHTLAQAHCGAEIVTGASDTFVG